MGFRCSLYYNLADFLEERGGFPWPHPLHAEISRANEHATGAQVKTRAGKLVVYRWG